MLHFWMVSLLMQCADTAKPAHPQGVQGISDIITIPGLVNVDFADVKAIMCNSGTAMLGVGVATGKNRAEEAALVRCSSMLPMSQSRLPAVLPAAHSLAALMLLKVSYLTRSCHTKHAKPMLCGKAVSIQTISRHLRSWMLKRRAASATGGNAG